MKKKKRNVPFFICLIVVIAAAVALAGYHLVQHSKSRVYDDLRDTAEVSEERPESAPELSAEPEDESVEIPIDFEALQAENPDIYAWITIPDTEVDYPILHSTDGDEDYYLDHTAEGTEGLPGALYTQYSVNPDLTMDPVTVIYGHNMKNGSMFGGLKRFQDEEYRAAHPEINIYTPNHISTWRIVCAVTYDDRHILNTYAQCWNVLDYEKFLGSLQTERLLPSWTEEPFPVTSDDRMLILSTCNGHSDQRYLIGAVLTDEQ